MARVRAADLTQGSTGTTRAGVTRHNQAHMGGQELSADAGLLMLAAVVGLVVAMGAVLAVLQPWSRDCGRWVCGGWLYVRRVSGRREWRSELMRRERELADLVHEWDPLDLADVAPDDEHDCVVGPLLGLLVRGGSVAEVGAYLSHRLGEHFGFRARQLGVGGGTDAFVSAPAPGRATWHGRGNQKMILYPVER